MQRPAQGICRAFGLTSAEIMLTFSGSGHFENCCAAQQSRDALLKLLALLKILGLVVPRPQPLEVRAQGLNLTLAARDPEVLFIYPEPTCTPQVLRGDAGEGVPGGTQQDGSAGQYGQIGQIGCLLIQS